MTYLQEIVLLKQQPNLLSKIGTFWKQKSRELWLQEFSDLVSQQHLLRNIPKLISNEQNTFS